MAERGAEAVIPSSRSRSQAIAYDIRLYKERKLVERFINKIKHYRRIATRYESSRGFLAAHDRAYSSYSAVSGRLQRGVMGLEADEPKLRKALQCHGFVGGRTA
jgi:transposase